MILNSKVLGKVEEQIITGHGPSGKEVVRHPALVKVVGKVLVGKNVHKELSVGFEEFVHLLQQIVVILHVFKHFHRHDQIVTLDYVEGALIISDVALQIGRMLEQCSMKQRGREIYSIHA
jgi:hypothetical protein